MKKIFRIILLLFTLTCLIFFWNKNNLKQDIYKSKKESFPTPTEIGGGISAEEKMKEEAESQAKREAWFDLMHTTAPGINWKEIEANTRFKRHQKRSALKSSAVTRDDEFLANDNLYGEWVERGSNNQAGRVVATEYDPVEDKIYLISDQMEGHFSKEIEMVLIGKLSMMTYVSMIIF